MVYDWKLAQPTIRIALGYAASTSQNTVIHFAIQALRCTRYWLLNAHYLDLDPLNFRPDRTKL